MHRDEAGKPFAVDSGVKIGCILYPLVYTCPRLSEYQSEHYTVFNRITQRLEDLDFADDICLLAHRKADMEIELRRLVKYAW